MSKKGVKMMKQQNQTSSEYQRALNAVVKLLDLDEKVKEKLEHHIRNLGIRVFFSNLEAFNFQEEVLEKLQSLQSVIKAMDGGDGYE